MPNCFDLLLSDNIFLRLCLFCIFSGSSVEYWAGRGLRSTCTAQLTKTPLVTLIIKEVAIRVFQTEIQIEFQSLNYLDMKISLLKYIRLVPHVHHSLWCICLKKCRPVCFFQWVPVYQDIYFFVNCEPCCKCYWWQFVHSISGYFHSEK